MVKISSGLFGNVFVAEHHHTDERFAIKVVEKSVIKKTFVQNGESYNEVILLHSLCRGRVRGMLQLTETFEDGMNHYIITKYYEGGDLFETINAIPREERLPEWLIKSIMSQLVHTVGKLHKLNILHRDI